MSSKASKLLALSFAAILQPGVSSIAEDAASPCAGVAREDLRRPAIEVSRERSTGNYFDDKVKVTGTIEGACLSEAGYYENGRKVEDIPLVTSRNFKRFEFQVKGRESREGEVRVYNTLGDRDVYELRSGQNDGGAIRGRYGGQEHLYDPLGIMTRP